MTFESLLAHLAERANEAEALRRIPESTIERAQASGFFESVMPRRWGGAAQDFPAFLDRVRRMGAACTSSAWTLAFLALHAWILCKFERELQEEVFSIGRAPRMPAPLAPTGTAEKVDGGYRFSGRWSFSSGVDHCEWIFLGGLLPKRDGSEGLEHTTFLLPKSDYRIERNWDVLGLRATGSHDIVVENAFVPEHRTQRTNDHSDAGCPGRELNSGWLYRIPFTQVFQRAVSSSCIGALDGAIASFRERAAAHVGKHGAKTAEDPNAQVAVAEAMMTTDQLKLVLFRNYARIVQCARTGERMPVEERLMQRAQASQVPKVCARMADELLRACAASGTFRGNPVERVFRDIHQARAHIANNTDAYARAHGAVMLGLPNADPFV